MGPVPKNGVMKLFVRSCRGSSEGLGTACQPCRELGKNETLGKYTQTEEGRHSQKRRVCIA